MVYRFTNTDYLDDVSNTYVDPAVFPPKPGWHSKSLLRFFQTVLTKQELQSELKDDKEETVKIKMLL